jgi:hypothetical protein
MKILSTRTRKVFPEIKTLTIECQGIKLSFILEIKLREKKQPQREYVTRHKGK